MIEWSQQSGATIGSLRFLDGRPAKIVLVGPREHPKGAVLICADPNGGIHKILLSQYLEQLTPGQAIEILCMQERAYGSNGLDAPALDVVNGV